MPADAWRAPPRGRLTLSTGAVHVWRATLDRALHPDVLTPEERERAERFRTPELGGRYLAGRVLVREVLARYLNAAPADLVFSTGARGKPWLAHPHRWLRFNASHSGPMALVAVTAGREVGVDLEQLRPVPEALAIARRMLSPGETEALRSTPPDRVEEAFLRCWTCKEAYIKALGTGLWTGLSTFDVSFDPPETTCLRAVDGSADRAARWTLRALDPGPGYFAALATEGPVAELSLFDG